MAFIGTWVASCGHGARSRRLGRTIMVWRSDSVSTLVEKVYHLFDSLKFEGIVNDKFIGVCFLRKARRHSYAQHTKRTLGPGLLDTDLEISI